MASISSLSRAISGLQASQSGLHTTAHNLTNVNSPGYVRQQLLTKDSSYLKIGSNGYRNLLVGTGTDVEEIRQVRDMFLDGAFRKENSRFGFYSSKVNTINEIETILGETEGQSMKTIVEKFWNSFYELSKHPDGREARGTFIQSAVLFTNKANLIMNQLKEYQTNLDTQVKDSVKEINRLGKEINKLNEKILKYEVNGDNANDYRDARNNALDKLSKLADITYKEDKFGNVNVKLEGTTFVFDGKVYEMTTKQAEPKSPFVTPVWKHTKQEVFNLDTKISPEKENDRGSLKGLLLTRGTRAANWTDTQDVSHYNKKIKQSVIMTVQAKFDNFIHSVVSTINNVVSPKNMADKAPVGLDGSHNIEIFKRLNVNRYTAGKYNDELKDDTGSLYSAGNLEINREVLNDYDKICISTNTIDIQKNDIVNMMLDKFKISSMPSEPGSDSKLNLKDYYVSLVGDIGNRGKVAKAEMENEKTQINQLQNCRSQLMAVSSDEEIGNMMKYQHAYNASARVVTVVDQMLEQVINRLGLVGR